MLLRNLPYAESDVVIIAQMLTTMLRTDPLQDENVQFVASLQSLGIIDRISIAFVKCLQSFLSFKGELRTFMCCISCMPPYVGRPRTSPASHNANLDISIFRPSQRCYSISWPTNILNISIPASNRYDAWLAVSINSLQNCYWCIAVNQKTYCISLLEKVV